MVPQPRRQNPQHQALTVTLKNICRDYPAGGGILRELLQNADDAGASEMVRAGKYSTTLPFTKMMKVFVLDTHSHPASNLLHPGLDEYQGPALLAYNNAKFSAKDFESLSSLGASRKEQDAFATGKFGRGFSSVGSRSNGSQGYVKEDRFSTGLIVHLSCLARHCSSSILTTHGLHHGTLLEAPNGTSQLMCRMTQ